MLIVSEIFKVGIGHAKQLDF